MPKEYAQSLQEVITNINKELEKGKIPSENVAPLQDSANELAKEMVSIKPEKGISFEKKNSISSKLIVFAKALVRASPKIAETVISLTPLAPFSRAVGTTFEEIVKSNLKEKSE